MAGYRNEGMSEPHHLLDPYNGDNDRMILRDLEAASVT
jgi:hypothetical protein